MAGNVAMRVGTEIREHLLLAAFIALYLLAGIFAGPFLLAYLLVAPSILALALVRQIVLRRRSSVRYDDLGQPLRPGEHSAYVYVNDRPEPIRLVWHKDDPFIS